MYEIYAHSRQVRQRARALHQALVRGRRTKVVRQCLYGHCIFLPFFIFAVMAQWGCMKTSRGRGDRRENSRQKLSRKSFSIGDFYAVKIFFV